MIKFLIIEQDLRISGTSQGIISRSFLAKLRTSYPNAIIDVVYLKSYNSDDQLDLLQVDSIQSHVLDTRIPFFTKLFNRFYWRIFHKSLVIDHVHKVYGAYIAKIDYNKYDHVFIRSAGLGCETILGAKNLPILKKSIITFNEPYPTFWCTGSLKPLTNLELFKLKEMFSVVTQAKSVMATSLLAEDMQYLYGSRMKFHDLPHQYCESVFDLTDNSQILPKNKKVTISYHGAIQFGRNIEILLDAYQELVKSNTVYKENTEIILRMKGIDLKKLAAKYSDTPNIVVADTLNFSNSCYEQKHLADINIILENGPVYCSILVGKAPFLATLNKPIFSLSPERSEMRNIIIDEKYIANMNDKVEIKEKLEQLILNRLETNEPVFPFGDYFSDENFTKTLKCIISDNSN
jgi:hypothetical protein